MSRARPVAIVTGLAVVASALVGLAGGPAVAEREPPLWLALGDSYASGEGIVEVDDSEAGVRCQRANGKGGGRAWSVVAYEELWGADARAADMAFTACSGAKSHEAMGQVEEARTSLSSRPEVVSLSFGGNDIGFGPILTGCIHLPGNFVGEPGCEISEDDLADRIDMLAGRQPIGEGYEGEIALPELYDQIAGVVAPGGHVFVLGYPQLFEEVDRWPNLNKYIWQACEFIDRTEIAMLRSAAAMLNDAIEEAVAAADARHDIGFHYVDVEAVYENGDGRHGLCSDEPWLNGFPVCTPYLNKGETCDQWRDPRYQRAYHPTQEGHTATGEALAHHIQSEVPELLEGPGKEVGEPSRQRLLVESDFEPAQVQRYSSQSAPPLVGNAFPCKPTPEEPLPTWTDEDHRVFLGIGNEVATAPDGSSAEVSGGSGSPSTQQAVWTFATGQDAAAYLAGVRAVVDQCTPLSEDLGTSTVTAWPSPEPGWTGFLHEYEYRAQATGGRGILGASVYVQRDTVVMRLTNDLAATDVAFTRSRVEQLAAIALDRLS